MKKEKPTRCNN